MRGPLRDSERRNSAPSGEAPSSRPSPRTRGEGVPRHREERELRLEQKSAEETDNRTLRRPAQCREGAAGAPLLHHFQILADLPVAAMPQSQNLQRRSACLPEAEGEGRAAQNPVAGAAADPGVDAGECRPAGAHGARIPSRQFGVVLSIAGCNDAVILDLVKVPAFRRFGIAWSMFSFGGN